MFLLALPSDDEIKSFLERQQRATFSYKAVGLSKNGSSPKNYRRDHNRIQLGSGQETWNNARQAVRGWKMFDMPCAQLCWPSAEIREGTTVAILIRHFGFCSLNASRIVYVIDEPHRFGFAYGTLTEHAESGEERFLVEWNESDDSVWYDLLAFSRPNALLARIAQPLARRLQHRFVRDSLKAMKGATRRV